MSIIALTLGTPVVELFDSQLMGWTLLVAGLTVTVARAIFSLEMAIFRAMYLMTPNFVQYQVGTLNFIGLTTFFLVLLNTLSSMAWLMNAHTHAGLLHFGMGISREKAVVLMKYNDELPDEDYVR